MFKLAAPNVETPAAPAKSKKSDGDPMIPRNNLQNTFVFLFVDSIVIY